MVTALGNTATQHVPLVAHSLFGAAQGLAQSRQVGTADSAEFPSLEIVPPPFDRIELRRRAGKLLQMQPSGSPTGQQVLAGLTPMNRRAIPDQQPLAGDRPHEHPQEAANAR